MLVAWLGVSALVALNGCAHAPVETEPALMPLRDVRLYESGVGYFERSGEIPAGASTGLPVPASHLDDALKTLVVLGKGETKVHGVEFASSVSPGMARALAGLPASPENGLSHAELLASLKGALVEIDGPERLTGKIIEVIDEAAPAEKRGSGRLTLLFVTEKSEVRRIAADDVRAVRLLDPAAAIRLRTAVDALSGPARARRVLRLLADTSGPVTLGYVAEVPLWRTTWRLVLAGEGAPAQLQGWALLHNDTDEDWRGVRVHLVNGRPDSYLYPLAAPRYARRTLVHPDDPLSTLPQLLHDTPDSLWGENADEGGLGLKGEGSGGGGMGSISMGSVGTVGHGMGSGFATLGGSISDAGSSSDLVSVGNLAELQGAQGVEAGALFSYTLASPIDLRGRGSALVPFLQQGVDAVAITRLAAVGQTARAGVKLTNSTKQTLPAGTLAVFNGAGLAGESALERLKPGEVRLISFAQDLDVSVDVGRADPAVDKVRALEFVGDAMTEHFVHSTNATWELENRSGEARRVLVGLKLVKNARVEGADAVEFDPESSEPLAVFRLKPREKIERILKFEEGLSRRVAFSSLTAERLQELVASPTLAEPQRVVVAEAAVRMQAVAEARKGREKIVAEIAKAEADLERMRKNLSALGEKGAGSSNPFVQRILALEDKLSASREKLEGADTDIAARERAVRDQLHKLQPKHG